MTRGTPYLNRNNYNDWKTPDNFYDELNKEFNFDFDPCPLNSKFNGLDVEWGKSNFVNPPYGKKLKTAFVKKAIEQSLKNKLSVLLLPVSTSTVLFHQYIKPNASDIRFVEGRLKFVGVDKNGSVKKYNKRGAMHDSMLVIFKGNKNG